jgi:cytochrome c oxidase assembly factor CtaG
VADTGVSGFRAYAGPVNALPTFGWGTVFTQTRIELAPLVAILLAAGFYTLGVRRLSARGDSWPVGRSAGFAAGLLVVAVATISGLAAYDDLLFGAHMVQHMLLSMVAPVLLALGAPVTLALRTLPVRGRSALLALLHARVVRVLTFPLIPWLLFVGSPFALYFSGWYPATLDNRLLHELLHAHLLLVGCLFFWPIVGIDPVPGRAAYPFRMLLLAATLPFHAFLGIAIMSVDDNGRGLIAASHYVPLRGVQGSVFQQQVGGGALWASGDLVGLLFLAVVLAQWMRASEREAAREDRRLDRLDASLTELGGAS